MKKVIGSLIEVSIQTNKEALRFFEPKDFTKLHRSTGPTDPDIHYRYMEGIKGESYSIDVKLHDHTKRYGVGIVVDGRSAMDGEIITDPSDLFEYQGGYLIFTVGDTNGGIVSGWRESLETVREFKFSEQENSYAKKMFDDTSALGTIVLAVFREDIPEKTAISRGLGTGIGDRKEERIQEVDFTAKTAAYEMFVIKYMTKNSLQEIGVWKKEVEEKRSNRFWPFKEKRKFCTFPD